MASNLQIESGVFKSRLDPETDGPDTCYSSNEEPDQNTNIVDWDGPDDGNNPRNWSSKAKGLHVAIISLFTLNA